MKKFKDLYREEKGLIVAKSHSFTKSEHAPKKKVTEQNIEEGSVQDTLYQRHQELRKKSGLPHPDYYKELGKSYDIEDHEQRAKKQAEIRAKYGQQREEVEQLEEMPGANMDTRAVHQHLKKKGWSLTRTSGGHDVFTHPESKEHIAVPRHRQLKAPLVKGILKQAKVNEEVEHIDEDLRNWFDPKHPEGGWKRINSKGEAVGPCAREPGEAKPKCMSNEKRASLTKKERAAAVASKRKHDPDPERKGEPINVSNYGKGKLSEENKPTNPGLWSKAKALAKSKFDVYPSAYANGWAAKWYKSKGGGWKSVNEETELEKNSAAALTYKDRPEKEPMPTIKTLAKEALKKQVENMKPMKESLDESRKAEIVKEIVKKKKEKKKESEDTYQAEPILSSQIVKRR